MDVVKVSDTRSLLICAVCRNIEEPIAIWESERKQGYI